MKIFILAIAFAVVSTSAFADNLKNVPTGYEVPGCTDYIKQADINSGRLVQICPKDKTKVGYMTEARFRDPSFSGGEASDDSK